MKKLITGLHKFQSQVFPEKKLFFKNLAKEQNPEVLFITCSDSRINPNLLTSTEPGDLFIIRNAGNIIPKERIASGEWATIEFAIFCLGIQHIVICGHSHCGAMEVVLDRSKIQQSTPLLEAWIESHVGPTLQLVQENYSDLNEQQLLDIVIQENVLRQIENIKGHPGINEKLEQKKLFIYAWIYKIGTGEILSYDFHEGQFSPIKKLV
ncbi:MAG TPA: carbonic anhydrase [Candidatus Babeliales bacterium]|nr:carbonic anhydrase [Candidatus Babeliales bacterium]